MLAVLNLEPTTTPRSLYHLMASENREYRLRKERGQVHCASYTPVAPLTYSAVEYTEELRERRPKKGLERGPSTPPPGGPIAEPRAEPRTEEAPTEAAIGKGPP